MAMHPQPRLFFQYYGFLLGNKETIRMAGTGLRRRKAAPNKSIETYNSGVSTFARTAAPEVLSCDVNAGEEPAVAFKPGGEVPLAGGVVAKMRPAPAANKRRTAQYPSKKEEELIVADLNANCRKLLETGTIAQSDEVLRAPAPLSSPAPPAIIPPQSRSVKTDH